MVDIDKGILKNLGFAREGLADGQYFYAAEICKAVLLKEPGCAEAWRILQMASKKVYEKTSKYSKVWAQIRSYCCVLSTYLLRKSSRRRITALQTALCMYPSNRIGLALLGQCAWAGEHSETLLFAYEELCLLFPEDINYGLRLGSVYFALGNYKSALKLGEQLLAKDPSNMEVMGLVEQASLAQVGSML